MAARVDHAVRQRHLLPGRRDLRRRQQRLGGRRRRRVRGHRRRPTTSDAILAVVGDRKVKAIVCTHAHDDHVRVAPALRDGGGRADHAAPGRQAAVGPDPHRPPAGTCDLADGHDLDGRPAPRSRCCTRPGHAPGAVCLYAADARRASSPATPSSRAARARPAAPTATADLIKASIRSRLLALPDETVVHTGHGDDTTIGAERAALGDADG